jgi:hypothetical protein
MNNAFAFPEPIGTDYDYIMTSRHGRLVMAAGQIAKVAHNQLHATGRCGEEIDLPTAQRNAEICAGQALAWLSQQAGTHFTNDRLCRGRRWHCGYFIHC